MRIGGALTLAVLLVLGLLGIGLSVCRDFMEPDGTAQMAGTAQDRDHCEKMCQLGQDESPALLEKVQPKFASDTVAIFSHLFTLPIKPHLHSIHENSRLDVPNNTPIGEVYLLNASFLI